MPDVDTPHTKLSTAAICDVMDRDGLPVSLLGAPIGPVTSNVRMLGRATTLLFRPAETRTDKPYDQILSIIDSASPGEVLVAAAGGRELAGLFGGLLATACQARGICGAVIDGPVRDSEELRRHTFPTFARGLCALDSLGREDAVARGVSVDIQGVTVQPGDYIFGDSDGVVVIPTQYAADVLHAAAEKIAREADMRQALADGMPVVAAFERYGLL